MPLKRIVLYFETLLEGKGSFWLVRFLIQKGGSCASAQARRQPSLEECLEP